MEQEKLERRELVSALADGRLRADEFSRALDVLGASDDALDAWHDYHVVGDVLRTADLADCAGDWAFLARMRSRLALTKESQSLLGYRASDTKTLTLTDQLTDGRERASANDAAARWKWLAAAASVAAIMSVGWQLGVLPVGDGPALASAPNSGDAAVQVAQPGTQEAPVMLRDPQLDELMAAHRQLGGTSALQMPAGFLRNATFESSGH